MGRSLFHFPGLIPPVLSMQERYAIIPAGRTLEALNSHFRVICFLEGGVEVLLPDGREIPIQRWDMLSANKPATVRYRAHRADGEVKNHVLAMSLNSSLAGELGQRLQERLSGFQHFPGALAEIGPRVLQEIREEAERGPHWSRWRVSSLALAILAAVVDPPPAAAPEPVEVPVERGLAIVNHARQFIQENAASKLTLDEIAWHLQLSGEHLARLFRRHAGQTVFDYVDEVRIDRAKRLLLTTELPLAQIATKCGYGSANLLGRHFKARAGQTPVDFRLRGRRHECFSPSQFVS